VIWAMPHLPCNNNRRVLADY